VGRDEGKHLFETGQRRFLVGTPATGGRGLQLVSASTMVYYSNSYDLEQRLNSEDRIHRIGQKAESVTYIDLVCPGTVDERIIFALRHNIDIATVILRDGYKQWLI
jgi:SNF2 family DNA or RNA helicase